MSKNSTRKASAPTLSVQYTPEIQAARDEVKSAATAYKRFVRTGTEKVLPQCVNATRHALESGYLVDGRDKDAAPGSVNGKAYAAMFGLASGSEVTFWRRLAKALQAGVTVGDEVWSLLAVNGAQAPLAKNKDVAKVIDEGGSVDAIRKACEEVKAARDRATTTRKARVASGESDSESPQGIAVSDDPIADANLAVLALDAALKRIPTDEAGNEAWKSIKATLAKVARRETTLRKAPAKAA